MPHLVPVPPLDVSSVSTRQYLPGRSLCNVHAQWRGNRRAREAAAPAQTRWAVPPPPPISAKASAENGQYLDEKRREEVGQFLLFRGFKKAKFCACGAAALLPT